jgi:NADPH-dependent ferric siderophore reductase
MGSGAELLLQSYIPILKNNIIIMSQVPKWLADTMEKVVQPWACHAAVARIDTLSSVLREVTFKGNFDHKRFLPGQEVLFRVDQRNFRHYTLSAFQDGQCSVLFYLNGKGPGSNWAGALQPGDEVSFTTEKGKMRYDAAASRHFFFGDETSLGLFQWYRQIATERDQEYFGVFELPVEEEASLRRMGLQVESVPPVQQNAAANPIIWIEQMHPACWDTWRHATYYLAGRAASIRNMKRCLQQKGVPASKIRTAPYWADGKTGL